MIKRILMSVTALVLSLTMIACGPLSKLDSTLDYAPFFFQGLVISGKITQSEADRYKQGVVRLEKIADDTKSCLSADEKPDAQCYLAMGSDARAALVEFYPAAGGGQVGQYVALVSDVINLIIKKNVPTLGAPVGNVDQQLDNKIDELDRLLKSK
jgi:hypothetical protein